MGYGPLEARPADVVGHLEAAQVVEGPLALLEVLGLGLPVPTMASVAHFRPRGTGGADPLSIAAEPLIASRALAARSSARLALNWVWRRTSAARSSAGGTCPVLSARSIISWSDRGARLRAYRLTR